MRRIFAISLGCPKNRVDTEVLLGDLLSNGFVLADRAEDADIAIVNTCAFIKAARRESINTLLDVSKRLKPSAVLVPVGCMVEGFRDEIARHIKSAFMLGPRELLSLREVLDGGVPRPVPVAGPRLITTPMHYAYLKIAEGCSRRCAFCIIPMLRGRQKSREPDAIIREARELASLGIKELILVAQDLTHWGADLNGRPELACLLRRIASEVEGIRWLRLMYMYPRDLSDELLDVIATSRKILKYLDLPVQHGDDRVLAQMRRGTDAASLLRLVDRVREKIPDVVLRTTYMVGFPGESDEAFERLIAFARRARFDMAGVFEFSRERKAFACRLKGQVPASAARERARRLRRVLSEIAQEVRSKMKGQVHEAVIEAVHGKNAIGRLWMQAPDVDGSVHIALRGDAPRPGQIVLVRITGSMGTDFVAEAV